MVQTGLELATDPEMTLNFPKSPTSTSGVLGLLGLQLSTTISVYAVLGLEHRALLHAC